MYRVKFQGTRRTLWVKGTSERFGTYLTADEALAMRTDDIMTASSLAQRHGAVLVIGA